MKILNLYAGIGGNRKCWDKEHTGEEHELTAIELNPQIAKIYQDFFPKDKVIVADAHQYLLEHFKEFEFIWSSPPCQSHSRMNFLNNNRGKQSQNPRYPDMKLYEEIIHLKSWYQGKWVVENVIGYYEPLIKPYILDSHYFWSNFLLEKRKSRNRLIRAHLKDMKGLVDEKYLNLKIKNKEQIINNCVEPELGLHILNESQKIAERRINNTTENLL